MSLYHAITIKVLPESISLNKYSRCTGCDKMTAKGKRPSGMCNAAAIWMR